MGPEAAVSVMAMVAAATQEEERAAVLAKEKGARHTMQQRMHKRWQSRPWQP